MGYRKPLLLGIDAGTGGIRAGLFDSRGRPVEFSTTECATEFPKYGWVEQNPETWWDCLKTAVGSVLSKSGVNHEDIAAIGAGGTSSTTVCVGSDGRCLRNAIMWMDHRASSQADRIFETKDEALNVCKAGLSAEWLIPKVLWIKENERAVYDGTAWFMEQVDWINYMLTGDPVASMNHSTHKWFYNSHLRKWPESFFRSVGLDGVVEKLPPRVVPVGEVIGMLSGRAARELGLNTRIPVVEGGIDASMAVLGSNVTAPGKSCLIGGSSHAAFVLVEGTKNIRGLFGSYYSSIYPGLDVIETGQVSTGSIIKWFISQFADNDRKEAERRGMPLLDLLREKASKIPIGSEGLVLLDFFQGNRTPYTDYGLQGAIWGLTLKSGTAHIFRAIMEGVAYGTENIVRVLRENGVQINAFHANGGITKSRLWLGIHADVCNIPVYVPEFPEATLMGSAVNAAAGAGLYGSLAEASSEMVRMKEVIEPDRENHELYRFYFDKYLQTYETMRDLMHEMSEKQKADIT